ncbi:GDSL-type esterase/lipase family protein [Niabella hirudinis]|uniref:GDSL-type esterase/lipase family protein n=1 Tax=Niabella hirudinis TaxID=1285929 RepID=UPI003EBE3C53
MKTSYSLLFFLMLCYGALQAQPKKLACVGNSVTFGWGLQDRNKEAYSAQLQQLLGNSYHVKNFGHSGATLLRKGHNPYYKTSAFRQLCSFKPDIAVIHLGLNDTDPRNYPGYRDDFIPDYNWLIDTLKQQNPHIKIFICRLTPIFTGHSRFLSSTNSWHASLQKKIEQIAAVNRLPLIDLNEPLHNRPDLFPDAATLHPNAAGAGIIANTVYQHISGNFGGLQIPGCFTSNMVLQREQPIKFWGRANAFQTVSVRIGNAQQSIKAGFNGKWQISFPARKASTRPQTVVIKSEGQSMVLNNVLIGDVWLCSGQSNMYFSLQESLGGDSLVRLANSSQPLRLLKLKPFAETGNRAWTAEELNRANQLDFFLGSWQPNGAGAAAAFSAIGYVFAQKIQQEQKVPIGIIEIAVGGSPLISWVSRNSLQQNPLFEPALNNWRQSDYIMQWCRERAAVNLGNAQSPLQRHPYEPAYNFEAAIEKLAPFPLKGILWYQGESDTENAALYKKLFPLFVSDWRSYWNQDLPFYYVQLSGISRPSWNHFRNTQRKLLNTIPNSGMAISSDLGDSTDVHYKNKIPVGLRLARLALTQTYHHSGLPTGPLFQSMKRIRNKVQIRFKYGTGLHASNNKAITGFRILTDRGLFLPAAAIAQQDQISITLPAHQNVVAIAYGWEPFTRANLVNNDQLPASTFLEYFK